MKRIFVLAVLLAAGGMSVALPQAQPDPTAIHLEKLKDGLYLITGGLGANGIVSGNTTFFIGSEGVVLIDTKISGFGQDILNQVRSVTNKPVTTVINTHTHGDHTGNNKSFPKTVEFVAHENTLANMARMADFKGGNAAFLPGKTYKDRMSLLTGKERIDLYYFGPGHTNGDTVIVFPALRVAVIGDLFSRKGAPLLDATGSAAAYPQTLAKAVSTLHDIDMVITGHSTTTLGSGQNMTFASYDPKMKWSDFQEYADFMGEFIAAADAARRAGKSVDEALASLKLPAKFKDYSMLNAKAGIQRLYDESKR